MIDCARDVFAQTQDGWGGLEKCKNNGTRPNVAGVFSLNVLYDVSISMSICTISP